MERTPNNSQHRKLTLEKKNLPPLLPGFELATFRSRVRHSYQQAILRTTYERHEYVSRVINFAPADDKVLACNSSACSCEIIGEESSISLHFSVCRLLAKVSRDEQLDHVKENRRGDRPQFVLGHLIIHSLESLFIFQ